MNRLKKMNEAAWLSSARPAVAWLLICLVCGAGCGRKPIPQEKARPFVNAVNRYLKAKSMDMKIYAVHTLDITGDRATMMASMAYAGGEVGVKVDWRFHFVLKNGVWQVTGYDS